MVCLTVVCVCLCAYTIEWIKSHKKTRESEIWQQAVYSGRQRLAEEKKVLQSKLCDM